MNPNIITNSIGALDAHSRSPRKAGLLSLGIGVLFFPVTIAVVLVATEAGLSLETTTKIAWVPTLGIICFCLHGLASLLSGKRWTDIRSSMRIAYILFVAPVVIVTVAVGMMWAMSEVAG